MPREQRVGGDDGVRHEGQAPRDRRVVPGPRHVRPVDPRGLQRAEVADPRGARGAAVKRALALVVVALALATGVHASEREEGRARRTRSTRRRPRRGRSPTDERGPARAQRRVTRHDRRRLPLPRGRSTIGRHVSRSRRSSSRRRPGRPPRRRNASRTRTRPSSGQALDGNGRRSEGREQPCSPPRRAATARCADVPRVRARSTILRVRSARRWARPPACWGSTPSPRTTVRSSIRSHLRTTA